MSASNAVSRKNGKYRRTLDEEEENRQECIKYIRKERKRKCSRFRSLLIPLGTHNMAIFHFDSLHLVKQRTIFMWWMKPNPRIKVKIYQLAYDYNQLPNMRIFHFSLSTLKLFCCSVLGLVFSISNCFMHRKCSKCKNKPQSNDCFHPVAKCQRMNRNRKKKIQIALVSQLYRFHYNPYAWPVSS